MTWNYRVMSKDGQLAIYEVFYKNEEVVGSTAEPVTLRADSIEEMKEESVRYLAALELPILEFED
ncbi:hypothetical protein ACO0LF_30605 [Undibacterium sp. Di27W]|uniref:hypothetical protein n=1 Tax=Undibacterium sp. Di27W TaxID=3413036 RepID=UPI003BF33431